MKRMIRILTVKIALMCAGLLATCQPAKASSLRRMTDVVKKHCFGFKVKDFASDLKNAFHKGKWEKYNKKAKLHWEKAHEPISRASLRETCTKVTFATMLGSAGLFGTIVAAQAINRVPKETFDKYSVKAGFPCIELTLGAYYFTCLLLLPKSVAAATAVSIGLYRLNNAKKTSANSPNLQDQQRARDWDRILETIA